jgi:hypothetical protein
LLIFEETIKLDRLVVMHLVLFLLSVSASANSLALKDGLVLSGTCLGDSTTAVRFLVGDRVDTYSIASVDRISFGNSGPASAPARTHDTRAVNGYTPTLRAELLSIMEEIRLSRESNQEQHISHDHYGKCRACGYRETCRESLA